MGRASVVLRTLCLLFCGLAAAVSAGEAKGTQPDAPEVLTLAEAAQFLRIDTPALEALAQHNEVPARRIGEAWRFSRTALLVWLTGEQSPGRALDQSSDSVQERLIAPPLSSTLPNTVMAQVTGRGTDSANNESAAMEAPEEPIGEAPEERSADEVFLRGQRVLLAPGQFTFDTGMFYTESDDRQLSLVDGNVGLATIEANALTTFLLGRVGIAKETELFVSTSYSDQQSDVFLGSLKLADSERSEWGGVRLGLRRTVLFEGPGRPDIILTLDGHIPTGDTSYAVGGGVAFIKSLDPAVLFASAQYSHTFSRDFSDVTRLEPDDRISVTVGYALALNDTLSLGMGLSGLHTGETRFDAVELRQQDRFSLQFGLTSRLAKRLYVEPTVSFGLSGPGNSFALGVTLPYNFGP